MQTPVCLPPTPSSCVPPASVPPQHPHGWPPCLPHVLHPASMQLGNAGRRMKGTPPFPLVTAPTHAHRQQAQDPPHPFVPHPLPPFMHKQGLPVYTQWCTGTCCPTPSPLFHPSCARGEGAHMAARCRNVANPQPPTPLFSPFMGEQGGMEGVGVGHAWPCAPPLPLQMGSPRG
jgi:hypothetical protein